MADFNVADFLRLLGLSLRGVTDFFNSGKLFDRQKNSSLCRTKKILAYLWNYFQFEFAVLLQIHGIFPDKYKYAVWTKFSCA